MSNPPGHRDRRKQATRLAISNVATDLFVAHGFDAVSVTEIAREAGVARKTVFNYFARKEDLVFDREDDLRDLVKAALAARDGQPPLAAFEAVIRRLLAEGHPLFRMGERPIRFWRMVADSPTLTARARELQVTLADELAALLAVAAGRPAADPFAHLAAAMLMATLVVAYREALRAVNDSRDPAAAFEAILTPGLAGVGAALTGTSYG